MRLASQPAPCDPLFLDDAAREVCEVELAEILGACAVLGDDVAGRYARAVETMQER